MMQTLRKVFVVLMFGILIVGFALWGVADYVNRQSRQSLASVGSQEITPQQFQRTYQRALENLSERAQRRITPQDARALGLPGHVLDSLIQDAALDVEARNLGVGLSTEGLRETIYRNERFQDKNGEFDPAKYARAVQQMGYTPIGFEHELKIDLIRGQLRDVIERVGIVPNALLEAYNKYINEQRTLAYFVLTAEAAGEIAAPDEDKLKSYYEDHKQQFKAPEFRKVSVVAITPDAVRAKIPVPDSELQAAYDAKKDNYGVPERRKIEAIFFQTKAQADAAAAKLASGKDFLEVAKEAGFKQREVDLDLLSKKEFTEKYAIDDKIADTAFSLEKGKVSEPLEGPVSTVILRVLEILPPQIKTFDEVKEDVRNDILKARTPQEMAKLTKAFEDERTAGVGLAEIAKKLDLPLTEATVDSAGRGTDGKPAAIPGVLTKAVAEATFKSDVGVENEVLHLPGGGYAWFDVSDIVKARQKPFEEVKADVEASWRKDQIRDKLAEKAKDAVTRIGRGEPLADVAKSDGAGTKTSKPLKRGEVEAGLPISAVAQSFALGEGGAGTIAIGDGTSRAVFQVASVIAPAKLDETAAGQLQGRLAQSISQDDMAEYIASIKARAGVTVDYKALAAVAGGGVDLED